MITIGILFIEAFFPIISIYGRIEIRYKGRKEYPKNYHDVFSELNDLTIEAKDAFYEEQSSF